MTNKFFTSVSNKLFPDAKVSGVERLTGGVSADVHRLDLKLDDGKPTSIVIRSHGATYTGHSAELEYQLLKSLHRHAIPVPEPLLVDVSRKLTSDPYLVSEFIEGNRTVSDGEEIASIDKMADMLVKIHSTSTTNLPVLPTRIDPLPELFDYLPEGCQWESLRNHLHSLSATAYTKKTVLLHGDFWPENLLWQNGEIAAVIDWEDAAYGDPLSDVACCRLELRYKFGKPGMQQFTQAYARHHSIDPARLALWQLYVAAAAQQFMSQWGLAKTTEAHMRQEALKSMREAAIVITGEDKPIN